MKIAGCKVFSATKAFDRENLGERITEWLAKNPGLRMLDVDVRQSSDSSFHCLTYVLWYGTV